VHEVLRVIEERARSGSRPGHRDDGLRIALAIEGGGMRGTVSAGMALALYERGLLPAFDAVYGSSAGAISGAWLLSSAPEGLRGWADPDYARSLIRWSAPLHRRPRRRPVVDVETLIEVLYQTEFPMDFASILASPIEYHPLATDAATGESTDLRPLINDAAELRLALRASASLPFLAGPPIELHGRRFYDAGVAESIPFRTPLAQGATHILVLRSRRPADVTDAADALASADYQAAPDQAAGIAGEPEAGPQAEAGYQAEAGPRAHVQLRTEAEAAAEVQVEAGDGLAAAAQVEADDEAAIEAEAQAEAEAEAEVQAEADGDPAADGRPSADGETDAEAEAAAAPDEAGRPSPRPARPPRSVRLLTRTTLRNESPELRTAMLTRAARNLADVQDIADRQAAGQAFTVFPPAWTPAVSRLTTDGALLTAALVAGREAVNVLFTDPAETSR
jgi:predicted patatin/cPLA2 family phospholipase